MLLEQVLEQAPSSRGTVPHDPPRAAPRYPPPQAAIKAAEKEEAAQAKEEAKKKEEMAKVRGRRGGRGGLALG